MSLAKRLRVLMSYLHVHDYCMSAKYLQTFVHVARTQALASSANVCHETATYVCSHERIHLHRNNPSSRLLVKPSIHTKELTKITEQSSREDSFSTWSSTCSSKSVTILKNAYCLKSRDYEHVAIACVGCHGRRVYHSRWSLL